MSLENAQLWTQYFVTFLIYVNGIEMIQIHKMILNFQSNSNPYALSWQWDNFKGDFKYLPGFIHTILKNLFLDNYKLLILFQMSCALLLLINKSYSLNYLLLPLHFLIIARFRGCFNGGSDYMITTILFGLLLNSIPLPKPFDLKLGFYYIGVQCTLSYFIAGVTKFKNSEWREGFALFSFLNRTNYNIPTLIQRLSAFSKLMLVSSWLVIILECLFPLIWFSKEIAPLYLSVFLLFHLLNLIL